MSNEIEETKVTKQQWLMRWIAFTIISLLFVGSALKNIFKGQETDKIISGLFLIVVGFAWGANLWKFFVKKTLE